MHELGVAQSIVEMATQASQGARVTRIVVEVGRLSTVLPDALRFCFDLATTDTVAEGADLQIVEIPGRGRCRACGSEVVLDRPYGRCSCGGTDLDWLSGDELRVRELEVL